MTISGDVQYSTKPMTLGDYLNCARIHRDAMDIEAWAGLLESRTSLSRERILALDLDDLSGPLLDRLVDAVEASVKLADLGKQLGGDK